MYLYMSAHFSDPKEVILQMGLREGMKVADLGAGSGHYSAAAAAIVNPGDAAWLRRRSARALTAHKLRGGL